MHFCIEVKVIIRILHFTRFFEHTAIILNTTVYTYANINIYIYIYIYIYLWFAKNINSQIHKPYKYASLKE